MKEHIVVTIKFNTTKNTQLFVIANISNIIPRSILELSTLKKSHRKWYEVFR
jgi:hypothetical protein